MGEDDTAPEPEPVDAAVVAPRRRGRPPKLNRERILTAARELPPDALTMQAVADVLGVDRKALNYYVSDRDGLLELVAMDAFETEIGRVRFSGDTDWRDLLRLCAAAIRTALVRVGVLITSIDFGGVSGIEALVTIERIFAALVGAGFHPDDAGRTMTLLAEVAHAAAREAITVTGRPVDPQAHNVVGVLTDLPAEQFPTLRRVAAARDTETRIGRQFDFDLALIIAGLERRLAEGSRTPSAP